MSRLNVTGSAARTGAARESEAARTQTTGKMFTGRGPARRASTTYNIQRSARGHRSHGQWPARSPMTPASRKAPARTSTVPFVSRTDAPFIPYAAAIFLLALGIRLLHVYALSRSP